MSQLSLGEQPGEAGAVSESPSTDARSTEVLRLTVAYDGTDFHGFAAQPDQRTVEGALAEAIARVVGTPITLACAGRTDTGVHAWGQVASVEVPAAIDPGIVQRAVNAQLGPEVVVRDACLVEGSAFHARRSALWRAYRYTIVNRPAPDPFHARYAWWVPEPLDLRTLRLAADPLLGEHDFSSFCRKGAEGSTRVRRVFDSTWLDLGDGVLRYDVRATAFCWQMVRSIVGTLVDVGVGRIKPGEVLGMLRARDRAVAGRVAPPHGLCLFEVGY